MKFTFKKEDKTGSATLKFQSDNLEEVVAEFEKFLRASGFDLGPHKFALVDLTTLGDFLEEDDFEKLMADLENDDDGSDDQSH
jgi:hypothetical protein